MAATWVLKFPQIDKPDQPILIQVTQKEGKLVDLDLLATDGEEAYRGKVRQRHLSKLQYKNFEGTEEDWTSLIYYTLVSKRDSKAPEERTRNLEVDCTISKRSAPATLTITLRSRIEDITHKLGSIELFYSEVTDDVDLFGWACRLADQRDVLEREAAASKKEVENTGSTITRLEKQVTDITRAKRDHEDQLLTKFAMLLNEKKAKIRDQQRVLQTARVDKKKLDELQQARSSGKSTHSSTKRKRGSDKEDAIAAQDESDGFEAMDVDKVSPADDDQDEGGLGQETPPRSSSPETVTASEDEDDVLPAKSATKPRPAASAVRTASPPPPPRSLPFQHKDQKAETSKKKQSPPTAPIDEDEETASEDDEL